MEKKGVQKRLLRGHDNDQSTELERVIEAEAGQVVRSQSIRDMARMCVLFCS